MDGEVGGSKSLCLLCLFAQNEVMVIFENLIQVHIGAQWK